MTTSSTILETARAQGVVLRSEHPSWRATLVRMTAAGTLTAVLRGVYALSESAADPRTRMLAVARGEPDAVLTGAAAAALTFWPGIRIPEVTASLPARRVAGAGIRFDRRTLSPELIVEHRGFRVSAPALTALDLCTEDFTEPIDQALRARATTVQALRDVMHLTKGRIGNPARRRLVHDSRDAPWSYAERLTHRILRRGHITGWQANLAVHDAWGLLRYLDVGFRRERLGLEIDGQVHLNDRETFETDRIRQNRLVLSGWTILRYTLARLDNAPDEIIDEVRSALCHARRRNAR